MYNQDLNESPRQAGKGPQPNVISKRTAELLRARYAMSEIYRLKKEIQKDGVVIYEKA